MAPTSVYRGGPGVDEPQNISFAPNMTEASFTSPEEPECAEANTLLFPPADSDATDNDSNLSLKRTNNGKKKDTHIPRPPNAFILFRSSFIKQQHIPGSIEGNHSQLSKIVGACWQRLSYEERQVWEKKAKEARAEHKRLYPNYRFVRSRNPTPKPAPKDNAPAKFVNTMPVIGPSNSDGKTTVTTTQSPTKPRRRANRMDDDPRRCEQIAKLLVAGHKGSSLEAMVKQFDAEAASRGKQEPVDDFIPPTPAPTAQRSSGPYIARRSSSCPPLDIAVTELFRSEGPKTTSGPIRRPKPLRGASTLPYPPTFKSSRSVSPPLTPSFLNTITTPIEGPFANSTFSFNSNMSNYIPQPESIGPKDAFTYSQLSSPTMMEPFYPWPIQPLSANNSFYSFSSPQGSVAGPSSSAPTLSLRMPDGHSSDTGWNSEFEWVPTEDEAGTSTAPPSTPDAPSSPGMGLAQGLPLEEVAAQASFSNEIGTPTNDLLDLSEYAKGLQLFSPQDGTFANAFQLGSLNMTDITPLNTTFDHSSDPNALWQMQNLIHGISPDVNPGTEEYRY